MSYSGSARNNFERTFSHTPNESTITNVNRMSERTIIPKVYSQPHTFGFQEHMPESEPLSEYSMPISLPRTIPSSYRQSPQATVSRLNNQQMMTLNDFEMEQQRIQPSSSPRFTMQSQRMNQNSVIRSSPYVRPPGQQLGLLPPPSPIPHRYVANYNPDQTFIMQPMSVVTGDSVSENKPMNKSTSGETVKKSSPGGPKLTSASAKRFFIGSIEQIVQWHMTAKQSSIYAIYEVAGILESVTSFEKGRVHKMILRSEQNRNATLQAVFYPIDRELPQVTVGQLVTCVGRMIGMKKLHVFNVWPTSSDSLVGLKRISFLCQRTLQETHLALPEP